METEIWKDIPGYEGHYQVSNLGIVKSLGIKVHREIQGNYYKEGRIKRQNKYKNGYMYLSLSNNGKSKSFLIHRLVGLAFIPNPENKEMINHKNGIKDDNRLENLEWMTRSENEKHKYSHLGMTPYLKGNPLRCWKGKFGGEHNVSVKICQYSIDGNLVKIWGSVIEASRSLGLKSSTGISRVLKGRRPFSGGYRWKYFE